jgi:hypothetical protein
MATSGPVLLKIPTRIPQLAPAGARRPAGAGRRRPQSSSAPQPGGLLRGEARMATRGDDRLVVELEWGITVYPARVEGDRWRAVWQENGERRQCEAVSEPRLAEKLEKVTERLAAGAPNMERPGADLIAYYLWPGRHPASRPWSRRHADTQRRLCQRFAAPVIAAVTCQDIKIAHMQQIVNAAPTAGEGERMHRCLSAMVTAGLQGGYLANSRLRESHWRPVPAPQVSSQLRRLSRGNPISRRRMTPRIPRVAYRCLRLVSCPMQRPGLAGRPNSKPG